jgi:hypothetical protein
MREMWITSLLPTEVIMKCSAMIERCCGCGRFFGCDPEIVPSAIANGKPSPVCHDCVDEANRRRRIYGLPLLRIAPAAYTSLAER